MALGWGRKTLFHLGREFCEAIRVKAALPLLLLILLTANLAVFQRVEQFDFVTFDDGLHVHANPRLNPPTLSSVRSFWTSPYQGLYVPLTYTAWAIQAKFAGTVSLGNSTSLNPRLFHLVNLAFHSLNTCLTFLLLSELGFTLFPAFFGALLFAWHPLQVEPVCWISSLKDLLSGFFVVLALWQYVKFAKGHAKPKHHYVASVICFLLGLLAKPSAIVFPLLAGIIDIGVLQRPWKKSVVAWVPWLSLAFLIGGITKNQQPDVMMPYVTPWILRPVVAADALVFYLAKLFFPIFLTLNYGRTAEKVALNPHAWSAIIILLLVFWGIARRKEKRIWATAALLFVGYLLPVLGFLPFYFQYYSTVADRFVYLAMLGPAIALSWWVRNGGKFRYGFTGVILLLLGIKSFAQTEVWRDTHHFIRQVSLMNLDDADVHFGLAVVLSEESQMPGQQTVYSRILRLKPQKQDEATRLKKQKQAIYHFQEAIRLDSKHAFAHHNLAQVYLRMGDYQSAIKHFKMAIAIDAHMFQSQNSLGKVLALHGRLEEAISAFHAAEKVVPKDEEPLLHLATAYERLGDIAKAKQYYSKVLALNSMHEIAKQSLAKLK